MLELFGQRDTVAHSAVAADKAPPRAKEAGHQELKQAPQLQQVVLERRTGQREPVSRAQGPGGARGLAVGVLDRLRLVEHGVVEVLLDELLAVDAQERVGGHHDVGVAEVREQPATLLALDVAEHDDLQVGREPGGLLFPVGDNRRRRDDQRGAVGLPRLHLLLQRGQRLDRLAEPHVVGEAAVQAQLPQRREPVVAEALVGAQLRVEARGQRLLLDPLEVHQALDKSLPRGVRRGVLRDQIGERRRQRLVDLPDLVLVVPFAELLQVDERGGVAVEPVDGQPRDLAVVEAQVAGPRAPRADHVAHVEVVLTRAQRDVDAKPVDAAAHPHRRRDGAMLHPERDQRVAAVHVDTLGLKRREVVDQEVERVIERQRRRQR